jgi:hypothetical protein
MYRSKARIEATTFVGDADMDATVDVVFDFSPGEPDAIDSPGRDAMIYLCSVEVVKLHSEGATDDLVRAAEHAFKNWNDSASTQDNIVENIKMQADLSNTTRYI